MPKSSKQLDAEIAVALSGIGEAPIATGEFYYAVYPDDEHLKLYGPYETWKDAAFAGYFHKSTDEREHALRRMTAQEWRDSKRIRNPYINFFGNGVEQHDEEAIQTLIHHPRAFKLKEVKIIRRTPPMHPSWKRHSADWRQGSRDTDWRYAEEERVRG